MFGAEGRAKYVDGLAKYVVVHVASVDGKDAHQQDDVASTKEYLEDLGTNIQFEADHCDLCRNDG